MPPLGGVTGSECLWAGLVWFVSSSTGSATCPGPALSLLRWAGRGLTKHALCCRRCCCCGSASASAADRDMLGCSPHLPVCTARLAAGTAAAAADYRAAMGVLSELTAAGCCRRRCRSLNDRMAPLMDASSASSTSKAACQRAARAARRSHSRRAFGESTKAGAEDTRAARRLNVLHGHHAWATVTYSASSVTVPGSMTREHRAA